jgi:plastocyanin domain-containing protein
VVDGRLLRLERLEAGPYVHQERIEPGDALFRQLDLPLNQRVWTDVTMPASGQIDFTCGMGMYRGAIDRKGRRTVGIY